MRDSSVISDALALTEWGKVLNPEDISNLRVRAQENLLELRTIDLLASTNSDRKDIKEIKSVMDYSEYPIPDFSDKQRRIDGGIGSMKKILELKGWLGAYIEKREEELTLQEQIKWLKGPDASEFSRNARKNLEFLNSVGFWNLENKQILTNTMAAMNEINPPWANNEPFIDPSLNTGLSEERQRALLNALVQITRVAYDAQPEGQWTEWEKSKKWMSGWRNTDLSDTILMRRMITSDGWRDAVKNVANGTESSRWNKDAIKSKLWGSISQESELPKVPTWTTMAWEPTMKVG